MDLIKTLKFKSTLVFSIPLLFPTLLAASPLYEFKDVDALLSGLQGSPKISSNAIVVNNEGHIAGYFTVKVSDTKDRDYGFVYKLETGAVESYGFPKNRNTSITDINNKGQFIGRMSTSNITGTDRSNYINRHGWEELESPLTSVHAINDSGDILATISSARGTLESSVAIWKEDYSVVDILKNVIDCDEAILGDCDGANRLDFDYWRSIGAMDMNNQGQIVFVVNNLDPPNKDEHSVYVYTSGEGVKKLRYFETGYSHGHPGFLLGEVSINNQGLVMISVRGIRTAPDRVYLYSSDGTDMTPETVVEDSNRWGILTINDSSVLLGANSTAFSLTDVSEVVSNDALFPSPYSSIIPKDINNHNVVVGYSNEEPSKAVAFMPTNQSQIFIDGSYDDWADHSAYTDVIDDGVTVNWDKVWTDEGNGRLSFSYSNVGEIDESQLYLWNIYLDTDSQSTTGYNFELLGADYLLQGKSLYQYTGTGQDWSWNYLKEVDYVVSGERAEFSIEKSILGLASDASNYRTLFYGTDPDGNNLDYLLIDVNGGGGSVVMEEITLPD